ncbi:MAG: monovalent cation/H(+) antiporter subunit G [Candidatus Krumholzibacteria bacterium]|nr:monovalent cation/H(+) antiporter subunit G [Candidatus Krumholzibacteria bacterium]
MNEFVGYVLLSVGVAFDLFGCIGLVRLPDVYNRLQAATKCATLGTAMILLSVFFFTGFGPITIKALLCIWFILITSPTAAHAISRAAHRSGIRLWEGSYIDKYAEDREGKEDKA